LRDEIKNKIQLKKRIKNQTTIKKQGLKLIWKLNETKWGEMKLRKKNELEKRYKKLKNKTSSNQKNEDQIE
jgi:hypothetical protein